MKIVGLPHGEEEARSLEVIIGITVKLLWVSFANPLIVDRAHCMPVPKPMHIKKTAE